MRWAGRDLMRRLDAVNGSERSPRSWEGGR